MKFRTAYAVVSKPHPTMSRFRIKYARDSKGKLIEVGKEDVHDSIQKAACGRLVEDLLRRASNGDPDAIPVPVDSFVDISGTPKDMLEAHTMLSAARLKFDSLDASLRSKFNNNFDSFLNACVDGSISNLFKVDSTTKVSNNLTVDELAKVRSLIGGNINA